MTNRVPLAIADVELQLATAIAVGGTSFTLNSANDDDGNALPAGLYCFTIDSGTSNKEYLIGQLNGVNVTSVKTVTRQGVETSGAARAHRIGAPCIITNFATLQRVADILRGAVDLDGASPVSYDTEPTLADRKELATVGYVLDTVTGGTVNFEAQTTTATAGETIVAGELVYFNTSDGEWYKTDADTASTVENVTLGIALGSGSDGAAITGGVLVNGIYTTTGLTANALYYASNTAGAIATSAGTTKKIIGIALSTTRLFFYPTNNQTLTTREKDAMAGGGDFGTPSTSNKYLTEAYIPSIPATFTTGVNKKLFISTATSELADNTTTETTIFSTTLTGGLLGTSNVVRAVAHFSNITTGGNAGTNPVFRLKYGATTIATITLDEGSATTSGINGTIEALLFGNGSTTSQFANLNARFFTNRTTIAGAIGSNAIWAQASGTATENSANNLTLSLTIQYNDASTANGIFPAGIVVELIS